MAYEIDYVPLGVEAKRQGRYQEALEFYNKAIGLNANDYDAYYSRAKTYFILKGFVHAMTDFTKCARMFIQKEYYGSKPFVGLLLHDEGFLELARHCGHAELAGEAYQRNDYISIKMSDIYREWIDPYYAAHSARKDITNKDKEFFNNAYERECYKVGFNHLVFMPDLNKENEPKPMGVFDKMTVVIPCPSCGTENKISTERNKANPRCAMCGERLG